LERLFLPDTRCLASLASNSDRLAIDSQHH
jgi:hypothetical protein